MKIHIFLLLLWVLKISCHRNSESAEYGLRAKYQWKFLDFQFPNTSIRQQALASGSWIPAENILLSMAIWKDKIFLSLYRMKLGVASSLNYFTIDGTTKSPLLIPYPSFDANYVNEDRLQKTISLTSESSVICAGYIQIDRCNRLWVVDSGYTNFWAVRRVIATPAIVIFNLKTNKLIRRYPIPAELINSNASPVNMIIDFGDTNCNDAYAYIADLFRSIIVYSFRKNRAWRFTHNFFGSSPEDGNLFFGSLNYQINFGLYGLALGEYNNDGSRRVYASAFSSTKAYYVSNWILQNEKYVSLNRYYNDVQCLGDRGENGQVYTMSYDEKTNVLIDLEPVRGQVGCWNTEYSFSNKNFGVLPMSKKLFYPNDAIIDGDRNLWVISSLYPTYLAGLWNKNDINMQIFVQNLDDALAATVCSKRRKFY